MTAGTPARRSARRALRLSALTLALTLGAAAFHGADAQEPERGCHCVDADGREIEGCRCDFGRGLRAIAPMAPMPRLAPGAPEVLAWSMASPRRARLGLTLGSPADDAAVGAPVEDVLEDGPADRAGLRPGDVIVALDGHELSDPVDREREGRVRMWGNRSVPRLLEVLDDLEAGEEVEIAWLRDGERRTATITPEENPGWERLERMRERLGEIGERLRVEAFDMEELEDRLEAMEGFRFDEDGARAFVWEGPGRIHVGDGPAVWGFGGGRCPGGGGAFGRVCVAGAELLELNPSLGSYFGTEEGVLVPEVDEGSPLGLRPGDVILEVDGRAVTSPEDARRILASYEDGEAVTFRILRQREAMEVRGRVER